MHTNIHKKSRISFCSLSKNKYTRESTAEELPFEWSNFRTSPKESKAGLKKKLEFHLVLWTNTSHVHAKGHCFSACAS